MRRLTGTWRGAYQYDQDDYPEVPPPVTFVISLTEAEDGEIEGHVQDSASEGGFPESGVIEGKRRGRDIMFYKTMPSQYVGYEDGLIDLSTWLRIEFRHEVDPGDLPPHDIEYSGTLDDEAGVIRGFWDIVEHAIEVPGEGLIDLGCGSGTFTMEKVSDETSDVTSAFGDEPNDLKRPSVPVKSTIERLSDPDNLRVEVTSTREVEPCPCCRGTRRIRAGHVHLGTGRVGSFLVYTTEGVGQHEVEADLIFGAWENDAPREARTAVSLVEHDHDGIPTVTFLDASKRPIAQSSGVGHAASPDEIEDTMIEVYALSLWRAIRQTL